MFVAMRLEDVAEDSAMQNRTKEAKRMILSYCCDAGMGELVS